MTSQITWSCLHGSFCEAAATHLMTLPIGQVTLSQHEAAGADVHLTPRTDQPHVLLRTNKTAESGCVFMHIKCVPSPFNEASQQ